jgi:hypothetical protein
MSECTHMDVSCINPYELIRKFLCTSCGEVMMCACEEEFGRRFVPHQLQYGTDLETQRRVPVTLGFQDGVCNSCRGLPEEAHPKSAMYGRSSKIVRYYWREIAFETTRRFAEWAGTEGYTDRLSAMFEHRDAYKAIEREVIDEIKLLHESSPKYEYHEESQHDVVTKHKVQVVALDATYRRTRERRVELMDGDATCTAEVFVARHFEGLGHEVLFTESRPFHALFGIFMWPLVQDPDDPEVRVVYFGDRNDFDQGVVCRQVSCRLPADFGSPGYAKRRVPAIEDHFRLIPENKEELLWVFDYWVQPSARLRQYLWAHRPEDVVKARQVTSVLPAEATRGVLRYLVTAYWRRYCGWPDLLVHGEAGFFFAEVKSSKDKLSEDQKNWIRGNSAELRLPFKMVKIHKRGVLDKPDIVRG